MQTNQRRRMETARGELDRMLNDFAKNEIKKISISIKEKLNGDNNSSQLRQMYADMEPIDVINDLVETCREICRSKKRKYLLFFE